MNHEEKCVELASHAIGMGNRKPYKRHGKLFFKPYRNYYAAALSDCKAWDEMVSCGYAKAGKKERHGGRTYWLTRKGLDWLGGKLGMHIHDEEE